MKTKSPRGFTLIELLVVMSIISLLLSLLLPSLTGAMRVGRKTACMANLRGMAQSAVAFATDNDDAIIGAPSTSGAYLAGQTVAYGAAVQRWDFMGPMAKMLGIDLFPNGEQQGDGTGPNAARRFNSIRTSRAFLCPSNQFLSTDFGGPPAGANRMISYNSCRYSLFIKASSGDEAGFPTDNSAGVSWFSSHGPDLVLTDNYKPKITRVGIASNKILFADGARYSSVNPPVSPDHDITVQAAWGGAFSDAGAFSNVSKAWDRTLAPGNGTAPAQTIDGRSYAFRHSTGTPPRGAPANAYKANVVFFDGHTENLGDLELSNPHKWLPQGSSVTVAELWPDAVQRFGYSGSFNIGP